MSIPTLKQEAAEALNIKPKQLSHFNVEDPFNIGNQLEGYVAIQKDHRLGALYLSHVNQQYVPQIVYGTPKMKYPFTSNRVSGERIFHFPNCSFVSVHSKLDGTNILCYSYKDANDSYFVTYKTRLTAVLSSGVFGDFRSMWKEILERYPGIPKFVKKYNVNLSFELYGSRNPHLIIYDTPLEAKLLFGLQGINVVSPAELGVVSDLDFHRIPRSEAVRMLYPDQHDLVAEYQQMQKDLENNLQQDEDGFFKGDEGFIWYMSTEDGTVQYKCKPETIESIHFAAAGKVSVATAKAACYKVIENGGEPDFENVKMILIEDYDERVVEAQRSNIVKAINEVVSYLQFRNKVIKIYTQSNIDISKDKANTMRMMSKYFSKGDMRRVYNVLSKI